MADEMFLCIEDEEVSISVSAGCRCCCETVTKYFDAGEEYIFDVGRSDGEVISASHEWQFNTFDVPSDTFKVKFQLVG